MIYQLLIRLLAPFIFILLAFDGYKRKGGWRFIKQRCGFNYRPLNTQYEYWLHCASVGEVNAALPLLKLLPANKLIVTTNTPTGRQFLHKHLPQIDHAYCPFDWPFAIKRFLKQYQPKSLWILETEIWPNLYQLCYTQKITIQIINGRLSQKTLTAPTWLNNQYKTTLKFVDHVYAKSNTDKKRFIDLGVKTEKVMTLGNIKFANATNLKSNPKPTSKPFILLASSHENEELAIVKLWQKIKSQHLLTENLVIAPRHPKRCQELIKQITNLGLSVAVYNPNGTAESVDIILIDEIGGLQPFYEYATVVIMGGSFIKKGGHNLLEPCAYGKAVLTGPYMNNFKEETELLLREQALRQCQNFMELNHNLITLLTNSKSRETLERNAKASLIKQSKVLQKYQRCLDL